MVGCGEDSARKYDIGRAAQDEYTKTSYARAKRAYADGIIQKELFPIDLGRTRESKAVKLAVDEETEKGTEHFVDKAKPLNNEEGATVTGVNGAKLADGAAAVVLMTEEAAEKHGCTPLLKLIGEYEPVPNFIACLRTRNCPLHNGTK